MAEEIILPVEPSRRSGKRWLILALTLLILAGVSYPYFISSKKSAKPVNVIPVSISRKVGFKVYYPDQTKLPAGYTFDRNSVKSPVKNGVAYTVSYGAGSRLVFSVQARPSDQDLQTFTSNYIPLKLDFQTRLGQAEIGAYRGQALVSLPIVNGPWVIVTAPSDVNQDQLKQVIRSLKTD